MILADAVRWSVITDFFREVPTAVLRHKLCDLAFTSKLRSAKPRRFTPGAPDEFVYWYTRPEGQAFQINASRGGGIGASTGVEIDEAEQALAKKTFPAVCRTLQASAMPHLFEETTLAFFFAALRQGIEQVRVAFEY